MTEKRRKVDWGSNWWFLPIAMVALLFGIFIGAIGGKTW